MDVDCQMWNQELCRIRQESDYRELYQNKKERNANAGIQEQQSSFLPHDNDDDDDDDVATRILVRPF